MTVRTEGLTCGPELNLVCICNGRFYGGGFNPTNDARPDDGLMDVLVASGVNRAKLLGVVAQYARGKYKLCPQYITYVKTTHLEVDCRAEEVINVDGECLRARRAVIDLIPGGVNFIAPRIWSFSGIRRSERAGARLSAEKRAFTKISQLISSDGLTFCKSVVHL